MNPVKSLSIAARLALVLAAALATTAHAQTVIATGSITATPAGGGSYDYTITLHNSASSTIGIQSLWYSWVPGQFYLPTPPTSILPLPSGWIGSPSANSIQFYTVSPANAIAPGGSLSFSYASLDTPAQEFGNSPSYPGIPVGTSVVYSGILAGVQDNLVVQPAPEPSTIALLTVGSLGLLAAVRRGKLSRSARA